MIWLFRFTDMSGLRLIDVHLNGDTNKLGHRNPDLVEAITVGMRSFDIGNHAGGNVAFEPGDVSSLDDCAAEAAAAEHRHGGLDILCCDAGVFPSARLSEMTPAQLDDVLAINLKGTVFTVQAAMPALKRSGRGRIIITSSITGPITGYSGWAHYEASKAGQLGSMRSAALKLARSKININAIMPGNSATEGLDELGQEYLRSMEASIPLGRLGSIEEVASAAWFLASEEVGCITGQTLVIDGGQTVPVSLEAVR
jgi:3-oxoacyl-[acyl-carrier protein] reductase